MTELEKMDAFGKKIADEEEKRTVIKAIITIRDTFPELILGTRDMFLGEEGTPPPLDSAQKALQCLHQCGKKYGLDFPAGETTEETVAYIMKFGREILTSDRHRNNP